MNAFSRNLLKDVLPPVLVRLIRRRLIRPPWGYFGNYTTWNDAKGDSDGYDMQFILERVKQSLALVRDGKAVYERDGFLFDHMEYSFPLLSGLLRVASSNGNRLNVLDFGGSLGSTYFQCREFVNGLEELHWNVVEQPSFVECGQRHFQTDQLRFYSNLDLCLSEQAINLILISGTLPYLQAPYEFLTEVIAHQVTNIIIDRTLIFESGRTDRLTVQCVPSHIYGRQVSYPAWIFSRSRLCDQFRDYRLVAEFNAISRPIDLGDLMAYDRGFIFTRDEQVAICDRPLDGKRHDEL